MVFISVELSRYMHINQMGNFKIDTLNCFENFYSLYAIVNDLLSAVSI